MKKSLLLCFAILLLFSFVLTANGKGDASAASSAIVVNPKGVFPIVDKTYEMSILTAQDPLVVSFEADENAHVAWIQENTNIKANWILVPAQQAAEKINLILASNSDLPDVFMQEVSNDLVLKYGQEGVFLPMNDLIETYGDEINRAVIDYEKNGVDFLGMYTAPDGNIYGLPSLNPCIWCEIIAKCWVRTDWMDTLGLEMPDTVEEFTNMLRAMKNGDPNGNGKTDEIPLMGSSQGWGTQVERYLMMPYIVYEGGEKRLIKDKNDIISAAYMYDEWIEGVAWIKSLIDEGLLDPVSLTQKKQEFQVMGEKEPPVVGTFLQSNFQGLTLKDDKYKQLEAIPPLESVYTGEKQTYANAYQPFNLPKFLITEACESPEAAYRYADFLYSKDNAMWMRFGQKDIDWIPAKPDQINAFGDPATFEEIGEWGAPTNRSLRQKLMYKDVGTEIAMADNSNSYYILRTNLYRDHGIYNGVPNVFMLPQEVDEFAELGSSLQNYVNEAFARFVTGDLLISDFDAFRDECKQIGLDRYLELYQTAYDRQFK
jgi:putative aldouronate transport system substrate-binding protein